ncbi:glycosyltransferase 87 family protein [Kribbella sp. NBC_01245]|uniref:glycosyltransferase 87 family protein n=1 Tax=Kribbella sp. NBC_01245 TaxID=2903578 RepID=UPI002E27EEC0|nr:glycosyltransferase 87 family protein [Kribbella sp. NBC_01245]
MTQRRVFWALVVVLALTPIWYAATAGSLDLQVYRTGGAVWRNGISLYSDGFADLVPTFPLPFTYPPFAAVLFTGLAVLPFTLAELVMNAISVAALAATLVVVTGRLYGWNRRSVLIGLGLTTIGMLLEPVRATIGFGQVNLLLMGLVTLDCLLPKTRWPRGLLLGLAAAIKLTPAVFVLYFLVRRQYRAAAMTFASFAGFSLAAYALIPADSTTYWFSVLFDPGRIGGATYAFNQCFQAVLERIIPGHPSLWLALVAITLAPTVIAARRARAAGDDVTAVLVIAAFGLLASPVSWSHHWVWVAPALIALVHKRKWYVAAGILAVFAVGPHQFFPPEGRSWSLPEHVLGSAYVITAVAAILLLAFRRYPEPVDAVGGSDGAELVPAVSGSPR